jgi:hypothetical protein
MQLETAHRLLGLQNKVKASKVNRMDIGATGKHFKHEIH